MDDDGGLGRARADIAAKRSREDVERQQAHTAVEDARADQNARCSKAIAAFLRAIRAHEGRMTQRLPPERTYEIYEWSSSDDPSIGQRLAIRQNEAVTLFSQLEFTGGGSGWESRLDDVLPFHLWTPTVDFLHGTALGRGAAPSAAEISRCGLDKVRSHHLPLMRVTTEWFIGQLAEQLASLQVEVIVPCPSCGVKNRAPGASLLLKCGRCRQPFRS